MSSKIQLRRDTADNWTATNPVLSQGEPGLETDTRKIKYGDGTTAWNLLDYAINTTAGFGDFSTGFDDGINDNTWHFVTVQGKKEFDYHTQGYKVVIITLTAAMVANIADGYLTFNSADTPEIVDVYQAWSIYENEVGFYFKVPYDQGNFSSNFRTDLTNPSTGVYRVLVSQGTYNEGDQIAIRYWSEGTIWTGADYDTWTLLSIDASTDGPDNTITMDSNEYNGFNWTAFANTANVTRNSISFENHGDSHERRNITSASIDGSGIVTITFDGAPIQVDTPTETTFTTVYNFDTESYNLSIPDGVYPNFVMECRFGFISSNTNKYTGGVSRSGWIIINGGSPINFNWYYNFDSQNRPQINLAESVGVYNGDTVEFHFYKEPLNVSLSYYNPNASYWNNGYKWFDWKSDIPIEYSPALTNAIQGGKGTWSMKAYVPEDFGSATMSGHLEWIDIGNSSQHPKDLLRNVYTYEIQGSYNTRPFNIFEQNGVVFYTDNQSYGSFSRLLKVRLIYKWDLIIAEDDYRYWYC